MLWMMRTLRRDRRGITGLETAIILIAFVVVASVFAYTVLSAGIFSSQRGKETIHAGLREARGTMELRGSVIAYKGNVGGNEAVVKISFVVSNAVSGQPVDLTPPYTYSPDTGISSSGLDYVTVISYHDGEQMINDMAWTVSFLGDNDGDYLLETNEKAEITVWLVNYDGTSYSLGGGATDPFMDDSTKLLGANDTFTLEVKPPQGAALTIERTIPAQLDAVMDLY